MAWSSRCRAFVVAALLFGVYAALFAAQKSPVVAVARKKLDAGGRRPSTATCGTPRSSNADARGILRVPHRR
ncbi:MAG: hypothetical protein DCC68_22055 [Planctomycetota bacterium]|nr:MAG: hypothetical protein DCC68_22055 [Planctomycetota bacterium]